MSGTKSPSSDRYLVTGAGGHLGGLVADSLQRQGHRVRLLTRATDRLPYENHAGTEVVRGDTTDPDLLREALRGVAAAFLVCGENPGRPHFEMSFIDAAASRGVAVVKLSAMGAAEVAPTFLRWHHQAEQYLRAVDVTWTVLRPNSLMDNLLRNDRRSIAAGRWPNALGPAQVSFLAGTDLADVAVTVLTDHTGAHGGQVHELTGPESLSAEGVAGIATSVLGHHVTAIDITPEELELAMRHRGAPDYLAQGVSELHAYFRAGHAARVTDTVGHILGRPATTLADYLAAHRNAFTHGGPEAPEHPEGTSQPPRQFRRS